jgi:hypothetical protein
LLPRISRRAKTVKGADNPTRSYNVGIPPAVTCAYHPTDPNTANMVSFRSLLLATTGALALPFTETHARDEALITSRAGTPNGAGEHGGFYYNFWSDGAGTINYQNKDNGSYHVSWQDCSNFLGGKGWYVVNSP